MSQRKQIPSLILNKAVICSILQLEIEKNHSFAVDYKCKSTYSFILS